MDVENKTVNNKYIAYCACGDALERKDFYPNGELYPNEARYYCFGCDKVYKLEEVKSV